MYSQLTRAVAQSRQQELLRDAEQRRRARDLPRRPSPLARFTYAIPSLTLTNRHSTELRQAAPAN